MAKTKLNPILEQVHGKVGDLVFKRYEGETVLSRKPDMAGIEPTEAQSAARERFRQAALYGKMALADPVAKAVIVFLHRNYHDREDSFIHEEHEVSPSFLSCFFVSFVDNWVAAVLLYEEAAKAKGQPVFSLMVADFFNAPSVDEVDLSNYAGRVGDEIAVRASDDFAVTGVTLAITNADGQAIEAGAASETPAKSGRWVYAATAAVPTGTLVRIAVTAKDRPGHTGVKTATKN